VSKLRWVLLVLFGFGFGFSLGELISGADWGTLAVSVSIFSGISYLIIKEN